MSVEVKTPTRSQYEYPEFPCREALELSTGGVTATVTVSDDVDGGDHQAKGVHSIHTSARPIFHRQSVSSQFQQPSKFSRKRRYSERPAEHVQPTSNKSRRNSYRYTKSSGNIVLPTKFLLGGNITDPLNLNSMLDEETNRLLNESTPHSSPVPLPAHRQQVKVIIPPNITDPLNLNCDDDADQSLLSPKSLNKKKHKRKYNKKRASSGDMSTESQSDSRVDVSQPIHIDVSIPEDNTKVEDKIVSPVINQLSPKLRKRRRTVSESRLDNATVSYQRSDSDPVEHHKISPNVKPAKFKRQTSVQGSQQCSRQNSSKSSGNKNAKFIFGNYNRYYGYRNPDDTHDDPRMKCFEQEWFDAKDVLDIGCNAGHLTLAVARKFSPRRIVGMDIDGKLIGMARKNIRHYMSSCQKNVSKFPASLPLCYGPLAAPAVPSVGQSPSFPNNVSFLQGNYVLGSDEQLELQKEEYDVVMALSVTKWIHFNWGDAGIKRFFRRIYRHLRPGGMFIMEPQAWASYKKKKKLTEEIFENFKSIQLRPEQFTEFLLSDVGFSTCQTLRTPLNKSKGFMRPIQVFTKSSTVQSTPCHVHSSTPGRLQSVTSKPSPGGALSPNASASPLSTSTPIADNTTVKMTASHDLTDAAKQLETKLCPNVQQISDCEGSRCDDSETRATEHSVLPIDSPIKDVTDG